MSDPGALAQKLVKKHFPKFGTIRTQCSYKQLSGSYNVTTGKTTKVITSTTSLYIIFQDFSSQVSAAYAKPDDVTILNIDKLAIMPKLDLPITPAIHDEIVDSSNAAWEVIGIGADPARAHYELHVRPIGAGP